MGAPPDTRRSIRLRPALTLSPAQAVAYRLAVQHLDERLPPGWLGEAGRTSAVRDDVPGAAALALSARVEDLVPAELERRLQVERSLLRLHAVRGAVHLVAREHAAVFGPGALGADEASLRDQLLGDWLALEAAGWRARDALAVVAGALAAVLADGVARTRDEVDRALRAQVPEALQTPCDRCGSRHLPDQLVRLAGTAGAFCYGRPRRGQDVLVNLDTWLARPLVGSVDSARVELARRFVHVYAPVVPRHLAGWSGIGVEDARRRFGRLALELAQVRIGDQSAWALESDLELLADPPSAVGVRLLPAEDPFLQQRDRATLLPDEAARSRVWGSRVRPGIVLAGGLPVATWRWRSAEGRGQVVVEPLGDRPLGRSLRLSIEEEAWSIAPFLGCTDLTVRLRPPAP